MNGTDIIRKIVREEIANVIAEEEAKYRARMEAPVPQEPTAPPVPTETKE